MGVADPALDDHVLDEGGFGIGLQARLLRGEQGRVGGFGAELEAEGFGVGAFLEAPVSVLNFG